MNPGDIVLVHFPFTSLKESKKRPALVLNTTNLSKKLDLVTVAMISSQVEGVNLDGDLLLQDWKKENLLYPSVLRLSKLATLEKNIIEKTLGKITKNDFDNIKSKFKQLFKIWIT